MSPQTLTIVIATLALLALTIVALFAKQAECEKEKAKVDCLQILLVDCNRFIADPKHNRFEVFKSRVQSTESELNKIEEGQI